MNNEKYENYKNISDKGTAKRSNKLREGMIKIHSLNITCMVVVKNGQTWSNVSKSPLGFIGSDLTPTVFYHLIINISKDGSVYFSAKEFGEIVFKSFESKVNPK